MMIDYEDEDSIEEEKLDKWISNKSQKCINSNSLDEIEEEYNMIID